MHAILYFDTVDFACKWHRDLLRVDVNQKDTWQFISPRFFQSAYICIHNSSSPFNAPLSPLCLQMFNAHLPTSLCNVSTCVLVQMNRGCYFACDFSSSLLSPSSLHGFNLLNPAPPTKRGLSLKCMEQGQALLKPTVSFGF